MDRDRALPEAGVGASGGGPPAEGYPAEPRTDQQVADAVRDAFFLDPTFGERQFRISAEGGVVRLGGEVHNDAERRRALDITTGVQGVNRVIDELVVA